MARDRVTAARAALAVAVLALPVLGLAGCGTKQADLTCPKVMPAPGADAIVLFGPGGHDAKDVLVGGRIYESQAKCLHEKVGLIVNAEISFYGERANLDLPGTTFPYFVALIDPAGKVMQEDGFKAAMDFLPGERYRRTPIERISVHLPLKDTATGGAYTVLVGFQLTPDQLAFNRSKQQRSQQ